jgi:hypothetical protein
VVQVIQKPNTALRRILFEGNSIAVDDIDNVIANVAQQRPDNSFVSLLQVDSVEMIDDRKKHQRMNVGLCDLCLGHDYYLNFF